MQVQMTIGKLGNTQKTGILKFYEFCFQVSRCSVQSEVKKIIIIVKSSLIEVRFNPCKMRFTTHLSNSSPLDISFCDVSCNPLSILNNR